jgi:hypothetical protein
MRPAFDRAWAEMADTGVQSEAVVEHCFHLIQSSAFHKRFVISEMADTIADLVTCVERAEAAGWIGKVDFTDMQSAILKRLMTIAAIYLVYGAVVGIGSMSGVGDD